MFLYAYRAHRDLHSFPTRRSSDLLPLRRIRPSMMRIRSPRTVQQMHPLFISNTSSSAPTTSSLSIPISPNRSEEHTSELQSLRHLVCRLLLEKKKNKTS